MILHQNSLHPGCLDAAGNYQPWKWPPLESPTNVGNNGSSLNTHIPLNLLVCYNEYIVKRNTWLPLNCIRDFILLKQWTFYMLQKNSCNYYLHKICHEKTIYFMLWQNILLEYVIRVVWKCSNGWCDACCSGKRQNFNEPQRKLIRNGL